MAFHVALSVLIAIAAYLSMGIAFGIAFVVRGIGVVDHAAKGSPWSFRLLVLPGVAALWPLMLLKWVRAAKGTHS